MRSNGILSAIIGSIHGHFTNSQENEQIEIWYDFKLLYL